ncbi:MAG: two-component system response regulator [Spirochaetes bacterium GWB1_59_5]|nr:MAG: two-component system response regulator [Spirochaetes bacterium GWB1_59_5]
MYNGIIVDDAMVMRLRLAEILGKEFKIVDMAGDGVEALASYRHFRPDFVTLDISMPIKNGIEVLQELLFNFPDAKVVMVSAVGQKQIIFEALGLGAKDFIIKPFEPARVLIAIKRLFS